MFLINLSLSLLIWRMIMNIAYEHICACKTYPFVMQLMANGKVKQVILFSKISCFTLQNNLFYFSSQKL